METDIFVWGIIALLVVWAASVAIIKTREKLQRLKAIRDTGREVQPQTQTNEMTLVLKILIALGLAKPVKR